MNSPLRNRRFLLGGGGFSTQSDPLLDVRLLQITGKNRPSICFLPTASGDSENYVKEFENRFNELPCVPTVLSLFRPHTADIEGLLMSKDVIYVGGGNTKNMLALWREWGLIEILIGANAHGCVLAGVSAGLICWFEEGITDSEYGRFGPLRGIGEMAGLACPHFDSESGRQAATDAVFAASNHTVGYGVQDGVALDFQSSHLIEAVTSRPGAGYFQYNRVDGAWQATFSAARTL